MKDVMSSVDIAAVTLELADTIVGQRIDNIYHIIPKTFLIRLRPRDLRLLIEVEKRIHLTRFNYPAPAKPTNFCMSLRKYLNGGTVESVEQYEFERIVNLRVSTREGEYLLVAESFRRGNLILVDPHGKVRLSLRYARMRDRDVIRNEPYRPAPQSGLNPLRIDPQKLQEIRSAGDTGLLKALTSMISLGPLYCREVVILSGLDNEKPTKDLTQTEIEEMANVVSRLRDRLLKRDLKPVIMHDERGLSLDVTPFPLKMYEGKPITEFKTYNEAADEFFSTRTAGLELEKAKAAQEEEKARLQRILKEQTEQKGLLEEAVRANRHNGDQIFLNLNSISGLLEVAQTARRAGFSLEEIQRMVNLRSAEVKSGMNIEVLPEEVKINTGGQTIKIRRDQTPQKAAEEYYAAAKKAAQKLKGLEESIRDMESRLLSLETKASLARAEIKIPTRMREKSWYERFHWFRSSDGFLVLSGKDAQTNEVLIKRYLDKQDLVFHAEIHGAPFTVIKTEGKAVPESTLSEAAQAAASRSKAWSLDLASLDVYWVKAEQVGMKAPTGEYLGRGEFMIIGKRNYVRGVELKIAIGMVEEDGQVRFIAGPPSAIISQTQAYVEVVPGRNPSGKLAKRVIEILKAASPQHIRDRFGAVRLDEVARLIPAGRGDIIVKGKIIPQTL